MGRRVLGLPIVLVLLLAQGWLDSGTEAAKPQAGQVLARLSGTVRDGATGAALPGAAVRIAGLAGDVTIRSDRTGNFGPVDLATGEYQVTVVAAGYLAAGAGRISPADEPRGTRLVTGSNDLEIFVWRPAAVHGRLTDSLGEPIVGARVSVLRRAWDGGSSAVGFDEAGADTTDDRGEYRIGGLVPSDYSIVAGFSYYASEGILSDEVWTGTRLSSTGRAATVYQSTLCGHGDYIAIHAGESYDAGTCVVREMEEKLVDVVVSRTGQPAANAFVVLSIPALVPLHPRLAVALHGRTDSRGHIVFPAFPEGGALLEAAYDGLMEIDPLLGNWHDAAIGEPPPQRVVRRGTISESFATIVGGVTGQAAIDVSLRPFGPIALDVLAGEQRRVPSLPVAPMAPFNVRTTCVSGPAVREASLVVSSGRNELSLPGPGRCAFRIEPPRGWWLETADLDGQPLQSVVESALVQSARNLRVVLTNISTGLSVAVRSNAPTEAVKVFAVPVGVTSGSSAFGTVGPRVLGRSGAHYVSRRLPAGDYVVSAIVNPRFNIDWMSREVLDSLVRAGTRVRVRPDVQETVQLTAVSLATR